VRRDIVNCQLSIDTLAAAWYNKPNQIGQFVTILSVNKTKGIDGRSAPVFCGHGCALFYLEGSMSKKVRLLVYGALIGALYVVLTHFQNLLIPGSATWAIQFRASEALCVLALMTPAAVPGLTVGCLLFNLSFAGALPLDAVVGSAATAIATGLMVRLRRVTVKGYPLAAMLMPAIVNAVLVGWELTVYVGGGFWLNALYVAIGEAAVLLTLGTALYYAMKSRGLDRRLFG